MHSGVVHISWDRFALWLNLSITQVVLISPRTLPLKLPISLCNICILLDDGGESGQALKKGGPEPGLAQFALLCTSAGGVTTVFETLTAKLRSW